VRARTGGCGSGSSLTKEYEADLLCPFLVLLVLKGTDDYTGHVMCLIGGLVFDASNKTGGVFNRSNLDL
jgi:hypothetical protein